MILGYTTFFVPDVDAALRFYTEAFGLEVRFRHEGGDWGELQTGTTRLSFASRTLIDTGALTSGPASSTPCFSITLVTDDVEGAFTSALAAGARGVAPPTVKPWGQTVAYVTDPNGFAVEIGTPMGA